jgi:hypothetical protein
MYLLVGLVCATCAYGEDRLKGQGLFPLGENRVLLFATRVDCRLSATGEEMGVVLQSDDGGASWVKVADGVLNAQFHRAGKFGHDRFVIFGDVYSEGPATDPFMLIREAGAWRRQQIYEGPAQLESAATAEGHLVAWIRHLKLGDSGWTGPLVRYESTDGGRTWTKRKAIRTTETTSARVLPEVGRQADGWRVASDESSGFRVERLNQGAWDVTSHFPWTHCEAPAESVVDVDASIAGNVELREALALTLRSHKDRWVVRLSKVDDDWLLSVTRWESGEGRNEVLDRNRQSLDAVRRTLTEIVDAERRPPHR